MTSPLRAHSASSSPSLSFPSAARERICVASYPFRNFIQGAEAPAAGVPLMDLKDFAAHVKGKFNINKVEPWSGHFPSMERRYLEQFRAAVETAKCQVANVAVDGEDSPYAADAAERDRAIAFRKRWIDAAATIGSPSVRTNIPPAKDSKPDADRAAASLARVAEYAANRNVVVSLENDNPVSEDPFFLVKIIEQVNSAWLRALPDFGNSLAHIDAEQAYRGVAAMFAHAYCICHVKQEETADDGKLVHVDLARSFGYLKQQGYKGYCSMEWDSPGNPYRGTSELIAATVRYLS